ncbi:SDR family oxidoreductase [Dactylosporangium fulvum]|uniref:SDR family oxidoreductase n=1 Tax=Dactylosporangium fulvum TaxID=53359 RepID=A0ABY5VVA6_9ACTN|nr:SDR family oxidoreductase [Dactylosporangium fulvum]UWP81693.1 SDR family oxidoreductase [Dactylosporangium fulvum]
MTRRWLITGCSTGLGRALAEAVAASGQQVLATARRPETLEELRDRYPRTLATCALDVRDPDDCHNAVHAALARYGGIDVLVNNAGAGHFGAVEEVTDAELAAQLDVNLVAPWRLTRMVLPLMRAQGHGDIVMVSSTAGRLACPGLGAYSAAKYALEGLVGTLALELAGTGVHVMAVEPGMFATEWGASLTESAAHVTAYDEVTAPMLAGARALKELPTANPPALFAAEMLRLIASGERPTRCPIGEDAWAALLDAAQREHTALLNARPTPAVAAAFG